MGTKKNFVLDTNVILHDASCLESFQDNNVHLSVAVLEELDKFKKGSEQINYNARYFTRYLDSITDDRLFDQGAPLCDKGAPLCDGTGRLYIHTAVVHSEAVSRAFPAKKPDHDILALADYLTKKDPETPTILVTKDVNLRMKARSIHVQVEDYTNDKVSSVEIFAKKNAVFEGVNSAFIDAIYGSRDGVPLEDQRVLLNASSTQLRTNIKPNDCFILRSDRNSVLARYNAFTNRIQKVSKTRNYGIEGRNSEQHFAFDVLNDQGIKLVALTGKAGTGKTLLALASALAQVDSYKQILLARPIVALSNKDIGFLPGDAKEKVAPYMEPLFDNLNVIKHQFAATSTEIKHLDDLQKGGGLVIEALAFIRGRSLSETYCIIDEAQNLTPHEVKTIITRAGEGTKIVFTGDIQQIDQPYLDAESNGLVYMINKLEGEKLFAHVNLLKGERSELAELASNKL